MTEAQRLWWEQSKSDLAIFNLLRASAASECHLLHYLQMTTEKLSNAYLWRSGKTPPKSHTGFVRFLKALLDRPSAELGALSKAVGFARADDFARWVKSIQTLAYSLQNMAPADAGNGPNPEYPWPHESPAHCPATHSFALWTLLADTGQGRKLIAFVETAVSRFPVYA